MASGELAPVVRATRLHQTVISLAISSAWSRLALAKIPCPAASSHLRGGARGRWRRRGANYIFFSGWLKIFVNVTVSDRWWPPCRVLGLKLSCFSSPVSLLAKWPLLRKQTWPPLRSGRHRAAPCQFQTRFWQMFCRFLLGCTRDACTWGWSWADPGSKSRGGENMLMRKKSHAKWG
jgi:hypothetical protein